MPNYEMQLQNHPDVPAK